jgi:O-antigen ligase
MPKELIYWIMFSVTSLVFGLLVAKIPLLLIRSLATYFEMLLVSFAILQITRWDKEPKFFINAFLVFAIVCAFTTVFFGVQDSMGQISMSADTNPNALGIIMVVGLFCVLYNLEFKKYLRLVISFAVVILFSHVVILTGSRKSLFCFAVLLLFWFLFVFGKHIKGLNAKQKISSFALICLVVLMGFHILAQSWDDSVTYQRIKQIFNEKTLDEGTLNRVEHYERTKAIFSQSPFWGIGFDQYHVYYGTYTHSTYAEVLACTGMIGAFLYLIPYYILFSKLRKMIKHGNNKKCAKLWIGMLLILIILGTVSIHFYDIIANYILATMIAFCDIEIIFKNKKYLDIGCEEWCYEGDKIIRTAKVDS